MATQQLSGAQTRTDRQGITLADRLAHEAGSYVRVTPEVTRAVTVYEVASARYAELAAMDARQMSGADFDSLALAQDRMNEARATLADAGQLHLIEMA